jgi:hypothetical protein
VEEPGGVEGMFRGSGPEPLVGQLAEPLVQERDQPVERSVIVGNQGKVSEPSGLPRIYRAGGPLAEPFCPWFPISKVSGDCQKNLAYPEASCIALRLSYPFFWPPD